MGEKVFCIIDHIYFSISCLARVRAIELPRPKWRVTWQTRKVGPVMKMFNSLNIKIMQRNQAGCETKTVWQIVSMSLSMARIFFGKSFWRINCSLYWKKMGMVSTRLIRKCRYQARNFLWVYILNILNKPEPTDNDWVFPF